MAAHPAVHPSEDDLRAFALGKLDDAPSAMLMNHLDGCPDCCKVIASLSGDDFLARLRQAKGRSSTPAPPKSLSDVARASQPAPSHPPIPNLPPELAANQQYEILRELGRGGMGVVYLAKNKLMDRLEVLKVVNKTLLDRPGSVERFLREIRSAAKLNHANVVAAYSAVQQGDLLAFAMEYIEGQDLASFVKAQGPLPIAHACYYAQQAALGLQHAHEKGMIHRDIKPQNLILSREGKKHIVKVLDFGLAKATREKQDDTGLTGEGKMLGTPDYIAPEQTLDAAKADIRADIYSLGCTLFYLLSGRPPFSANGLGAILLAHQMEEAKPLNLVRPEVPEELAAVVRKMMAKAPAKRYQTPVEVVQALAPFVRQGATSKPSPELAEGPPKTVRPKPTQSVPPPVPSAAPKPIPPEALAPVAWDKMTEKSVAAIGARNSREARERKTPPPKLASRRKWRIGAGIGVGVLLLGLLGAWAGGVFKVKIKDGTIVLENLPPDAEVTVDGEKVTLQTVDGNAFAIGMAPGRKRRLQVKKEGFTTFGEEVEIEAGGRRSITVRSEPLPVAAPEEEVGNSAKPKADYDAFATGRWVPILTAPGDSVVSKGAVFKDGVLEVRDGEAVDRTVRGKDMIVRAKVKKGNGRDLALVLRQNTTNPANRSRYAALYFHRNRVGAGKAKDNAWTNPSSAENYPIPQELNDAEFFEFAAAIVGDTLTIYINGKRVHVAHDNEPLPGPGTAGVAAEWCQGIFKDVEVQILDRAAKSDPAARTRPSPSVVALTPAQAALKEGQRVTVQFRVKGAGLNAGKIPQLYSEANWNVPGCFLVRFLPPAVNKFRDRGIPDVLHHYRGKLIRITGKITLVRYGGMKGAFPCIYVDNPDEIQISDGETPRQDGFLPRGDGTFLAVWETSGNFNPRWTYP